MGGSGSKTALEIHRSACEWNDTLNVENGTLANISVRSEYAEGEWESILNIGITQVSILILPAATLGLTALEPAVCNDQSSGLSEREIEFLKEKQQFEYLHIDGVTGVLPNENSIGTCSCGGIIRFSVDAVCNGSMLLKVYWKSTICKGAWWKRSDVAMRAHKPKE